MSALPFVAYVPESGADDLGNCQTVGDGCCAIARSRVLADPDGQPLVVEWHSWGCPTWARVDYDGASPVGVPAW